MEILVALSATVSLFGAMMSQGLARGFMFAAGAALFLVAAIMFATSGEMG